MHRKEPSFGDHIELPRYSRRNGMRIIRSRHVKDFNWDSTSEHYGSYSSCDWEVITNDYGSSGFVNRKPSYLDDQEYNHIVKLSKNMTGKRLA